MKPVPKPATIPPKKETPVPEKMTTKEKVIAAIQRAGIARQTLLLQRATVKADELKVIVRELEAEGKIKSWPYRARLGMVALYTLPDAKDPRTKEMIERKRQAPEKKAAPAKAGPPVPPVPRNGGAKSAPRPAGNGAYAAVIVDLESRRDAALADVKKYVAAIETLRAIG